jgi:stress response protein YsnF
MTNQDTGARQAPDERTQVTTGQEPLRLSIAEEQLEARVVERDQGKIVVHKRIETDPVIANVDLYHDDMVIDEVVVDEDVTEQREPWHEGDSYLVPVYEEVLVTYTQLRLKKIIRIHNRRAKEEVKLSGTVRREVVEIEELGAVEPPTPLPDDVTREP